MISRPLEGITVLDFTQYLAGPLCTRFLSDLGAEVIKVERPVSGDETRVDRPSVCGTSGQYMVYNRGKKSIALNLKDLEHRNIVYGIAKKADVVVENFKPGIVKKLCIDYDTIKELNPEVVYCSISGFGQTGPHYERGALDIVIQAESGFMSTTGEKGGEPMKAGPSIADVTAGITGAMGVLSAIIFKMKTGKGQYLDVSMLDSMVSTVMSSPIARYGVNHVLPKPLGNRHPASAPFQEFKTQDGSLIVACQTDKLFESLMIGLDRLDIYEDPRYKVAKDRYNHMEELSDDLGTVFAQWTTADVASMMRKRGLPYGIINNVDDVLHNEQILARDILIKVDDTTAGDFTMPGFPVKMSSVEFPDSLHSPSVGEHSVEVVKKYLDVDEQTAISMLGI